MQCLFSSQLPSTIHSIPWVHLFFFGPHRLMVFLGRMVFKKSLPIFVSSTSVPKKSRLCPTTGGNATCFYYSFHSSITRKGQLQLLTSCPFRHALNTSSGVRLLLKNTDKLSKDEYYEKIYVFIYRLDFLKVTNFNKLKLNCDSNCSKNE